MWNTRKDAELVRDVHPYRKMMFYLMPTRNESAVYMDQDIDLTRTRDFIERFNAAHPDTRITLFHLVLWAAVRALDVRPDLNRFVAGGKIWQRKGVWITYAAKKAFADDAPLVTIKRHFEEDSSFEDLVASMYEDKRVGRSDERSHVDKELGILLRLPGPLLRAGVKAIRAADARGLLPLSFTEPDPMYASVFLANLGSLKMNSAFHHLYEYGNCPIFGVIGQIKDVPAVEDGRVVAKSVASLRWSFDERIADGFYAQKSLGMLQEMVEDPAAAGAWAGQPLSAADHAADPAPATT